MNPILFILLSIVYWAVSAFGVVMCFLVVSDREEEIGHRILAGVLGAGILAWTTCMYVLLIQSLYP